MRISASTDHSDASERASGADAGVRERTPISTSSAGLVSRSTGSDATDGLTGSRWLAKSAVESEHGCSSPEADSPATATGRKVGLNSGPSIRGGADAEALGDGVAVGDGDVDEDGDAPGDRVAVDEADTDAVEDVEGVAEAVGDAVEVDAGVTETDAVVEAVAAAAVTDAVIDAATEAFGVLDAVADA